MEYIKIIHENIKNNIEFQNARECLSKAERIYFLGFGYNKVNIERLGIDKITKKTAEIKGTCVGLGNQEIKKVRQNIKKIKELLDSDILAFLKNVAVLD